MKKASITWTILASFLTLTLLAGCQPAASSGTATQTTAGVTSQSTPAATTTGTTAAPTASPTTVATTQAVVPAKDFNYRALPANQDQKVDLDSNKVLETILFTCKDKNNAQLTLNGQITKITGEVFLTGWFFLIDLDARDPFLDIAVQKLGTEDDYFVTFLYYDGSKLIQRGKVPGMICDPYSKAMEKDPFGLGTIHLDGLGNLVTIARGAILHTWFLHQPWTIGPDKLLKPVDQAYYPMNSSDPDTGKESPETAVKMRKDLPLFDKPGSTQVIATARSGQTASLVQTDNREWVQLRTQDGKLGWFQVIDYFQVKIGNAQYFSDEVFEGLSFAD